MEGFILKAPIEIEMQISVINIDDPSQLGTVTYGLRNGEFPTKEDMQAALKSLKMKKCQRVFA